MKLNEQLNEFIEKGGLKDNYNDKIIAPNEFRKIAQCILSGYFEVKSNTSDTIVKVIPTTVEFYYHEEAGDNKDYIVYHRNHRTGKKVPYFQLGLLHNHVSGIDITFESDTHEFRASALIRAFKIQKVDNGEITSIVDSDEHSTHLYDALYSQFNIFDGFSIKWHDGEYNKDQTPIAATNRKNVAKYDDNQNKIKAIAGQKLTEDKKFVQDMRRWSFSIKE